MNKGLWLHGTAIHFDEWKLPLGKQSHKGGINAHSAIFFTSSNEFALGASNGSGGLCSSVLDKSAKILDMNKCSDSESEKYRIQCTQKKLNSRNPQVIHKQYWTQGWKSGSIMKYAASSQAEYESIQAKLAIHLRHTPQGLKALNDMQQLTRDVIEELVIAARELNYDAVIGNEIDTLHPTGPKTYPIMFVLNHKLLSPPNWIATPKS